MAENPPVESSEDIVFDDSGVSDVTSIAVTVATAMATPRLVVM